MLSLSQFPGFTEAQIKAALHMVTGTRKIDFRYELLDKNGNRKKDLLNVTSGEIRMNALADIKRTARFSLKEDTDINYLSDRIKAYMRLWVPSGKEYARSQFLSPNLLTKEVIQSGKRGWVEFPLGVFHLSSPKRKEATLGIYREVESYGGLIILRDDKFDSRLILPEGKKYYDAIVEILLSAGITKFNIEYTASTLQRSMEFEAGKEKLYAINELLRQINYTPIYDDVNGIFTSSPYRSPSVKANDYAYRDDELSVLFEGMEEELDLFGIPNKWVVVCSNPEQPPMGSMYTNDNPESITSTVSIGRTIMDYREVTDMADQATLDAYVRRIAFEASQVYGKLSFETAIMPMHDYSDVLEIEYSPLNIKGKYSETSWVIPLSVGGKMKHEVRKVVSI